VPETPAGINAIAKVEPVTNANPIIAILTDFGTRDWFVASMKGRVHQIAGPVPIVDITHEVPPGDIASGAFAFRQCRTDFPVGTIFLGVVDPGVGTARRPLVVRTDRDLFVGPDNGLASAFLEDPSCEARAIQNRWFYKETPSHTFHGRDVFAPVAAHLATDAGFERVGYTVSDPVSLPRESANPIDGGWTGRILYFDRFGNAVTSIDAREPFSADAPVRDKWIAQADTPKGAVRLPLRRTYGDVGPGQSVAYFGSTGLLELAVNRGDARVQLKLQQGGTVTLKPEQLEAQVRASSPA